VAVFLALALTAYAVYFVEGRSGSRFRWPIETEALDVTRYFCRPEMSNLPTNSLGLEPSPGVLSPRSQSSLSDMSLAN
jgi:hypothetical protein